MAVVSCVDCGSLNGSHDLACPSAPFNKDGVPAEMPSDYEKGRPVWMIDPYHVGDVVPSKESFPTTTTTSLEVRTTSSTGGQKGVKPQRYSLIPRKALEVIGEIYDFGAKKYADHNWRKGYEWSKSYDALQRHLNAWWDREDNDPESGLSHLGHAGFHIFALIVFNTDPKYRQFDDRYKPEETK